MGNSQPTNTIIPIFDDSKWKYVQSVPKHSKEYGQYYTLENLKTRELIDEYQIGFSHHEDYQCYLNSVVWRLRGTDIVKTLYIKQEHLRELCNKTFKAKIYIQHIKYRLSSIQSVPFPTNLYIAICALDGFHKLFDNLNYFRIEKDMICIDNRSHIKVWLNQDLSKNYPSTNQTKGNETQMVKRIIQIVSQCTDAETQPQQSLELFFKKRAKKKLGFQEAKIIVSQYARKYNRQIPDNVNILEQNTNSYESQENLKIQEDSEYEKYGPQKQLDTDLFYSFNPIMKQQENQNLINKKEIQHPVQTNCIGQIHRQQPIFTFQGPNQVYSPTNYQLENSALLYQPICTAQKSPQIYFRNTYDTKTYSSRTPIKQYSQNMWAQSRMTMNMQGAYIQKSDDNIGRQKINSPIKYIQSNNRVYIQNYISQKPIAPLYSINHAISKQSEFQSTRQIQLNMLTPTSSKKFDDISINENGIGENINNRQQLRKSYKNNPHILRNISQIQQHKKIQPHSTTRNSIQQQKPLRYFTVQQQQQLDPDIVEDLLKMHVLF